MTQRTRLVIPLLVLTSLQAVAVPAVAEWVVATQAPATQAPPTQAPPGQADGPGTAAVRKANEAVSALLRQKPAPGSAEHKRWTAELNAQMKAFLDVDALGQRALADHWASLTAADRRQYLAVLRELVEANYLRALRSNLDYQVVYVREESKDDTRRVVTELHVVRDGRPEVVAVEYLLRPQKGSLRAFDLVTDGVGLVENYRGQFNQIIAKEGFKGLIGRMKKKKAELGT